MTILQPFQPQTPAHPEKKKKKKKTQTSRRATRRSSRSSSSSRSIIFLDENEIVDEGKQVEHYQYGLEPVRGKRVGSSAMKGVPSRCMPGGASVPLRDRREPLKPLNLQSGARKSRTKTKRAEERWIEIERKHVEVSSSCHEEFVPPALPRTKSDRQAKTGSTLEFPTSCAAVRIESSQVPTERTVQPTPSDSDMNPSSSPIEPGWLLDDSGKVVKVSPDWEEEPPECEWAMRKWRADDVVARCRQLGTQELSSASPPLHSPTTLFEAKWDAMRGDVPSNRPIQVALVNDLLLGAVAQGLELNRMTRKRSVDAIKCTQGQPSENSVRPAKTSEPPTMPTCRTSTAPADPTIEGPNKPLPRTTHLEPSPLAELPVIPRFPNPPSTVFLNPREYYVPYLELPERTKLQLLQRAYASSSSFHSRTEELPFDWGEGEKGRESGREENLPRVWGNAPEVDSLVAWVGSGIGPG